MTALSNSNTRILRYYSSSAVSAPQAGTSGSAGLDIRVAEDYYLYPQEQYDLKTGLHVEIPTDHFGLLVPRSSTGKKGLRLLNTVGIIDSDYRGEIILSCMMDNDIGLKLEAGDRVAQMLVLPYAPLFPQAVYSLQDLTPTARGTAGFGSTGVK